MKKILLAVLLAVLVLAVAACGGNDTTTTSTQAKDPATSTPTGTTTPANTNEPADTTPPLYEEGEDILFGKGDYMAIDAFTFNSRYPFAFEDFHASLDFQWAVCFHMSETAEGVYEQLIITLTNVEEGENNYEVNNQYKWSVEINGTSYDIQKFGISNEVTGGWVRLGLGEEYEPAEGNNTYDVRLKIHDVETEELIFWAWLTHPEICGGEYKYNRPAADAKIPDPNVNLDEVDLFDSQDIVLISGPEGNSAEEYPNLFDKDIRTKLCSSDITNPVIFMIPDRVISFNLQSISLVGANDDDVYSSRIVKNFKLYGSTTFEGNDEWHLICDVNEETAEKVSYQERNYTFTQDSSYRFYKIEIVHEGTYQIGEILLYAEKNSIVLVS